MKTRNDNIHSALPLVISTLLSCTLALFVFSSMSAHAAGRSTGADIGRIYGYLLDGTNNNAPVANQSLTLQMTEGGKASDLRSTPTDTHGAFSFSGLSTSKTINYAIYTRYQGAPYVTNLIDLSSRSVQQLDLVVYDATTSTAKIDAVQTIVVLDAPPNSGGFITVSEYFFFKNADTHTYVGSLKTGSGKPNALLFSLPPGARDVSLIKGFDQAQTVEADVGFATNAAVPPGVSQFVFSFQVSYTSTQYDYTYTPEYPTEQLSVLVPSNLHATSALTSIGIITANSHPYHLFQSKDLPVGARVPTQITGLPAATSTHNSSTLNPTFLLLIVGLLIMLAILFVTWFLSRSTHRSKLARTVLHNNGQRSKQAVAATVKIDTLDSIDTAQSQQQTLLEKLLELDKAFEAGKIKKSVYSERRAKIKARLRALMSAELEEKALKSGNKEGS